MEKIRELFTTKIDRELTRKVRVYVANNSQGEQKVKIQDVIEEALTDFLNSKQKGEKGNAKHTVGA